MCAAARAAAATLRSLLRLPPNFAQEPQRAKEIEMNARSVRILREKEGFSDTSVLDRAAEFARQRQMRVEAKRAQRLEEENAQIAEAKEAQRLRCLENAKMLRARRHRRRHDDRPPPSPALSLPPSPPPLSPPAPRHLRPRRCPPCSSPADLHAEHA